MLRLLLNANLRAKELLAILVVELGLLDYGSGGVVLTRDDNFTGEEIILPPSTVSIIVVH